MNQSGQPTHKTRAWLEVDIVCSIRSLLTSARPVQCSVNHSMWPTENTYQAAEKCVYASMSAKIHLTRTTVPHSSHKRTQGGDTGATPAYLVREGVFAEADIPVDAKHLDKTVYEHMPLTKTGTRMLSLPDP